MNEEAFRYAIMQLDVTEKEEEVMRLVCQGFSNSEIARIRKTSSGAVEKMLQRMRRNFGLDSKVTHKNPRVHLINVFWNTAWSNRESEVVKL
jgi:DNA-binding NarL/FixJ family response regulator